MVCKKIYLEETMQIINLAQEDITLVVGGLKQKCECLASGAVIATHFVKDEGVCYEQCCLNGKYNAEYNYDNIVGKKCLENCCACKDCLLL